MTGPPSLRVAVMGAGAVGCYYGFLLARAGHAVTLIGRRPLVEAVAEGGLVLETAAGRETAQLLATTEPRGVADADLVLVCVKANDTEAAGRLIAPHLAGDAAILSLQNGVDNAERLAGVLGRSVVPAAVYVATEMAGPAHVLHKGRGDLILGPSPASVRVAAALAAAGIPATVSERAVEALWGKLILNCAYNALSALTQLPYGCLVEGEGVPAAMADVVAECVAVAAASGVSVPGDTMEAVRGIAVSMAGQRSSTAQDLARGRPSEIDHLNGFVVRLGAALGVPTPANRMLHTLVKLAEGAAPAPESGPATSRPRPRRPTPGP